MVLRAKIQKVRVSQMRSMTAGFELFDSDNLLRIGIRQRAQQHSIHNRKIAVDETMPSASVNTATMANPGFFASVRTPKRKSLKKSVIADLRENGIRDSSTPRLIVKTAGEKSTKQA